MKKLYLILLALILLFGAVSDEKEMHLRHNIEPITTVTLIVVAICYIWKGICALFGVRHETTYTKVATKNGFKHYYSTTFANLLIGVDEKDFSEVRDTFAYILSMSGKSKKLIADIFEDIADTKQNVWMEYGLFFDKNSIKKGSITYSSLFSKLENDDTFSLMLVAMDATFQVNDDIRLRHDRTVVGKFSDTTKTVVEYIPRQMAQSDVDALFWFFQLVTYKFIAQQYGGITLDYPEIDIKK